MADLTDPGDILLCIGNFEELPGGLRGLGGNLVQEVDPGGSAFVCQMT